MKKLLKLIGKYKIFLVFSVIFSCNLCSIAVICAGFIR